MSSAGVAPAILALGKRCLVYLATKTWCFHPELNWNFRFRRPALCSVELWKLGASRRSRALAIWIRSPVSPVPGVDANCRAPTRNRTEPSYIPSRCANRCHFRSKLELIGVNNRRRNERYLDSTSLVPIYPSLGQWVLLVGAVLSELA